MRRRLFDQSLPTLYHHLKMTVSESYIPSLLEVKIQYAEIEKKYHPQRPPQPIQNAYKILSNEQTKKEYDHTLTLMPNEKERVNRLTAYDDPRQQDSAPISKTTQIKHKYKCTDFRQFYSAATGYKLLQAFRMYGYLKSIKLDNQNLDGEFMLERYASMCPEEKESFLRLISREIRSTTDDQAIKDKYIALFKLYGSVDYAYCIGVLFHQMYSTCVQTRQDFAAMAYPGSYRVEQIKSRCHPDNIKNIDLEEQENLLGAWATISPTRHFGFFQLDAKSEVNTCLSLYQLFAEIQEYSPSRRSLGQG